MWLRVALIFLTVYLWFKKRFQFWKVHGFVHVPGSFPIGSSSTAGITEHTCYYYRRKFNEFKHLGPAFGVYMFAKPMLMITDTELIKDVLVRNFDSFYERGVKVKEEADPLSSMLPMVSGREWRELRAKLTPAFTSGKMKMMFPNVIKSVDRMVEYLKELASKGDAIEMKEMFAGFTTEVIADVAFGLETKCLGNPENEFNKIAKRVFNPNFLEAMRLILLLVSQKTAEFFKIGLHARDIIEFFTRVIRDALNYRDENNFVRNDFLQLLIDIRDKEGMSFNQIVANSAAFFAGGFETSSSAMMFASYELALNQEIQSKLRDEIMKVISSHGEITYEAINDMKYLEMVFSETMRKYPILDFQARQSVKDFPIPNTELVIPAKVFIMIPAYGLHHDERFWENPDKFDPERFNEVNVKKIVPFSYIPFSEGPRQCIGMRFAQMQAKAGLVKLLTKFKILTCEKTIFPMKFTAKKPFQYPEGGMWLKLERIVD